MSSPNSKLPNLSSKTEEFVSKLEENTTTPLYKNRRKYFVEGCETERYKGETSRHIVYSWGRMDFGQRKNTRYVHSKSGAKDALCRYFS